MSTTLRLAMLVLAAAILLGAEVVLAASSETTRTARGNRPAAARKLSDSIEQLINQLGSDQYFLRRQAEEELIERGADAFDPLQEAEKHPDLEIAARSHYILQQIRIEWTRPGDSAEVQAILHRYGELSKAERVEKMDQLLALAGDAGLGAMCRIARFEPAPHLARYAALKLMQSEAPTERATQGIEVIARELGASERTPAKWLRTYAEQLTQPERVLDDWLRLVDEETAMLTEDSPDTEAAFVFELIDFHLDLCHDKQQPPAAFASLRRRTDLYAETSGRLRDGLLYAMNWIWENEQWATLELVEDHYADTIRKHRLLIYFSAAARWKQGRDQLAEEFAERAFELEADDLKDRRAIGDLIGEMGRHDWSEREWWYVVEKAPVLDDNSLLARRSLASLRLHDRGEDKWAAELMAEVCDTVEKDAKLKGDVMRVDGSRALLHEFHCQREYFLACQAAAEGDFEAQRKHLDAAYGYSREDADVLIAMYRSSGADEDYREAAIGRIRKAADTVATSIEQEPDESHHYNHWAWLVSNTEGDYEQAVKHSLRSLELSPDSPSYLDTLGRCYYAVGDLEKAVKAQREAVRRHPHLQVMRDQLKLFESALAERQNE